MKRISTMKNGKIPSRSGTLSRRAFIGRSATALAGVSIVPRYVLGGPGYIAPSDMINMAMIGVGGQGTFDMRQFMQIEGIRMVAVADPVAVMDYSQTYFRVPAGRLPAKQIVHEFYADAINAGQFKGCNDYVDYREMLEKETDIDAVGVSTTDSVHAVATMAAMKRGKHVYTQKPMAHDIYEARKLAEAARQYGVKTQMGNQGHAEEGIRLIAEWVADGAIGEVREVHCWTNRPIRNWPQGIERPTDTPPVPETVDWDLWLGPAPNRPYHPSYVPFFWRGYWDFGTGVMGDMGCHVMDIPVTVLKLGHPTSVVASSTPVNDETAPLASLVEYEFPAREELPPVKMMWYDGGLQPPRPVELEEGRSLPSSGTIFVGSKGKIMCADYGGEPQLIPQAAMDAYTQPPKTIPRVAEIHRNFIDAIRNDEPATSNFDVSGPLTEIVLLTNLATRAGRNVRLQWDGPNMQVTNVPEANLYVMREYREGWSL
jgi:predicted dehydrogenase